MQFNKDKFELVYATSDYKDGELIPLAIYCSKQKWRLVLIMPTRKKYSFEINKCFSILGDALLLYEITMGMGVVLESRARKYVEYHTNSKLYEKNPFFEY